MKKLTVELDDNTFAWLEVLVVGLAKEGKSDEEYLASIGEMTRKKHDDFGNGISNLLTTIADSLATGVKRPGCWERNALNSLTGYEGTYVPTMFDDCIKEEAEQRGFKIGENEL